MMDAGAFPLIPNIFISHLVQVITARPFFGIFFFFFCADDFKIYTYTLPFDGFIPSLRTLLLPGGCAELWGVTIACWAENSQVWEYLASCPKQRR